MLGVPGLFNVYRSGGVTLCSAPGAGVADDKAIYVFVPDMIKFYLGEKPILENVQTWRCAQPDDLQIRAGEPEGAGRQARPRLGRLWHADRTAARRRRRSTPSAPRSRRIPNEFIAQPTLDLSTAPILGGAGIEERHVDFRPYCLVGKEIRLTPGGLTRVALKKGSLVVNSSQGGGVKDTWILADRLWPMRMLSRTAENMFWMGRYMERADATARLIEMGYRMAMLPGSNEQEEWRSVAAASGSAPDIVDDWRSSMAATRGPAPAARSGQSLLDPLLPHLGRAPTAVRSARR